MQNFKKKLNVFLLKNENVQTSVVEMQLRPLILQVEKLKLIEEW